MGSRHARRPALGILGERGSRPGAVGCPRLLPSRCVEAEGGGTERQWRMERIRWLLLLPPLLEPQLLHRPLFFKIAHRASAIGSPAQRKPKALLTQA